MSDRPGSLRLAKRTLHARALLAAGASLRSVLRECGVRQVGIARRARLDAPRVSLILGSPAGATRVISIAAYQAAYEQYDYAMASAVAMIMGFVQLAVVTLILSARALVYRGAVGGGKG